MATVLIEYQGNVDGLEASLKEIEKANEQVSDSAKQSAKQVSDEYRKVAQASKAAFASEETKKALDEQNKSIASNVQSVNALARGLKVLFEEEKRLIASNKQNTEAFKRNQEEGKRVREEYDKLRLAQRLQAEETKKANEKTVTLRTSLKELKNELASLEEQGKRDSKQFQEIAIEAAKLETAISNTDERIRTLSSATFVFDAAVDSVRALAGGFAVAQGAIGLFAEDNQELQEAIAKTNAALAILNGLQEVSAFLTGQSAGKLAVLKIAQGAYSVAVGTSVGAIKAFRLALIATGIGAFVVALGFVAENFTKIKTAALNLIPGLRQVSEFIGNVIDKAKELLGLDDDPENNFLAKLVKAQERALEAQVKNLDRQIALQQKLGNDTVALEIKREQIQLDFAKKRLDIINANEDAIRQAGIQTTDILFELNQEILDRENEIQILRIKNEEDLTQKISDELRKRAAIRLTFEDSIAPERAAQETLRIDETTNEELLNQRARFLQRLEAEDEGGLQNRLNIIRTEGDAQIAGIKERLGFTRDAQNQIALIEAETQERIREERKRTRDELIKNINIGIDAAQQSFNAIADLAKDSADRRIEQINRIAEVEAIAIENSRSSEAQKQREREALETRTTRKVIEERRKLARIEKAQGIFNATIDTAQAIVGFLSDPGGVAGIILSVAAGITGATQIAKISSEPLPSFGKGGWIEGEKHTRGGVNINAEGGEFITKASTATVHKKELEAMNTSRAAFLKVIEERYVRPRLMEYALNKNSTGMNVNVDAKLNSSNMESQLKVLTRETKRTGKAITTAMSKSYSSRYNWN